MSAELSPGSGPESPSTLQRFSGGRGRKAKLNVGAVILAVVAVVGGGGSLAFLKFGAHIVPARALPKGNPSIAEATDCWREGKLACAEGDFMAYLEKYPNDQRATAQLSIVLTEDGRHKEALPYYAKAEALGANTYDFHAAHARSLEATGDIDGAIKANYRALGLVPSLVDVRGSLADELVRKGRTDEALNLLETFDRSLEDRGEPAYFTQQIARIRAGHSGKAAAEAASADAAGHLAANDAAKPGAGETLVPLKPQNGVLHVPVLLNDTVEAEFTVDSGASDVVLSDDVFRELLRQKKLGRADYLGSGYGTLADGSVVAADLYNIRSLKVGDRTLHNITAAVSHGRRGQLLLGQSFLRRFKSWSIDNKARVLVLKD